MKTQPLGNNESNNNFLKMTKKEEIFDPKLFSDQHIKIERQWEGIHGIIYDAMEEYGKYCAEQAWLEGMTNAHRPIQNCVDIKDWWNEFKNKQNGK